MTFSDDVIPRSPNDRDLPIGFDTVGNRMSVFVRYVRLTVELIYSDMGEGHIFPFSLKSYLRSVINLLYLIVKYP